MLKMSDAFCALMMFDNDRNDEVSSHRFRWIVDTGAQDHNTCNEGLLQNLNNAANGEYSYCVFGRSLTITHYGDVPLTSSGGILWLRNVELVPKSIFNLVSEL
ncbi:hypothetical protein ACH5RR_000546 [Cinchona calisaya]|uniref:Retrovirus-related Pol polyprotein from transposon TNT 1-94-like beta-barrel domain-containing protein n=1 Tax=Cinchona calisaya TaxID=153742 RepID=A0ABD3B0Y4_9GENT